MPSVIRKFVEDALELRGDALDDVGLLEAIPFVMKGGIAFRAPAAAAKAGWGLTGGDAPPTWRADTAAAP